LGSWCWISICCRLILPTSDSALFAHRGLVAPPCGGHRHHRGAPSQGGARERTRRVARLWLALSSDSAALIGPDWLISPLRWRWVCLRRPGTMCLLGAYWLLRLLTESAALQRPPGLNGRCLPLLACYGKHETRARTRACVRSHFGAPERTSLSPYREISWAWWLTLEVLY